MWPSTRLFPPQRRNKRGRWCGKKISRDTWSSLQVSLEIFFPHHRPLLFRRWGGNNLVDGHIRNDPFGLNLSPLGGVVLRSGKFQSRTIAQRQNRLHRSFSKSLNTKDHSPSLILESSSHNFRGTRTSGVHQNNQRFTQIGIGCVGPVALAGAA